MEIAASVAERKITSKKNGARTGFLTDPFRMRQIGYESGLEEAWLMVKIVDPDVFEIREQQRCRIPFKGEVAVHYFDMLLTMIDGRKIAGAVKYRKDTKEDLRALLRAGADTVGDSFADDWKIYSESQLTRTRIRNARKIIDCGQDFDFEAQNALAIALVGHGPEIRVADCDAILGDGERGSRAAMALIQSGKLVIGDDDRLGRNTVLRNLFTN